MTIETIVNELNRISEDSWYIVYDNGCIRLTIDDFEGFDEDWNEVEREYENPTAVEEVLDWLEENADNVEYDLYDYYHFGDITVVVGFTSFDI